MKTIQFLTIVVLFTLCSCNNGGKTNAQKVTFGIYETVKIKDIPASIIDSLKTKNIRLETDTQQPIIGYLLKSDSLNKQIFLSKEDINLVRSAYPVDGEGKYYALVAIKKNPVIDNSDIQKTITRNQIVEIHFNLNGARKWAKATKNNIGNSVAFIIDNQMYNMPIINGEIKSGMAIINGLKNETIAKKICESLNESTSN
jgi:preprotein translocase subunit SecD